MLDLKNECSWFPYFFQFMSSVILTTKEKLMETVE